MKYQFSFNTKEEIIFINESPFKAKIGSLIRTVIDTDWAMIDHKLDHLPDLLFWDDKNCKDRLREHLSKHIHHPALLNHLIQSKPGDGKEEFVERLDLLENTQEVLLLIMEALVDEDRNVYIDVLFNLLYMKDPNILSQYFFQIEDAKMVPFTERIIPVYAAANEFPYLFETDDIRAIIFQEILFLCNNKIIARKCSYCQKFFWTTKLNQVYCHRKAKGTNKTCAQIGPAQVCCAKQSNAYKLYWKWRTKLFNRHANSNDRDCFQAWIQKANPYRDLAKQNKISEEEMFDVLQKLESEIYCMSV